jgi:hypothetical protein
MKRYLVITIVIIVLIIVIVAGILILFQNLSDDENQNLVGGGPGNWKVGDYWQSTEHYSGTGAYVNGDYPADRIDRYDITSVNSTSITVWYQVWGEQYDDITDTYQPLYASSNLTLPFSSDFDLSQTNYTVVSDSYRWAFVGNESIDTIWGTRSAEHYEDHIGTPDTEFYWREDTWFVNGIQVKYIIYSIGDDPNSANIVTGTVDANFPQVVYP